MSHPSYPSGARKRQKPFQNDYLEQSFVHHRVATYQQSNDRVNHYDTAPRRPSTETETRSHPHFINKNHHWQPSRSPPSPPQEELPMTTLPSFSTLSKIADGGVSNINHEERHEHKPRSPRKSNYLDGYHHHNTPLTPPLSLSSRSQSGSHPSPQTVTTHNSQERPLPVPTSKTIRAPTYHDSGQFVDTRPYLQLAPLMGSSEPRQLVSSPPATKRQCIRPPPQPVYSQQTRRPNLSRPPEQLPATQPNSAYPVPPSSHAQPTSFYLTSPIGFEHHHYIAPSSVAYPLPQERYNCPDCGRAFSRPSSLKIHTYSHTGEKPFYCGVRGCNKNFSVRSNMKRHERGCHARKN